MTTVYVKPHPDLDPKAWPLITHPASGSLLDASGNVPDDGRPWLNDGFTARMLTDGAIIRGDHPAFPPKDPDAAPKPDDKADDKADAARDADKSRPPEIRKPLPPLKPSDPDPTQAS